VPAHRYRFWGSGVCEPPTDAHFRVKTIGWWGMTETITQGTIGLGHLPNPSLSMGRCAPEYEVRIRVDGREAEPGETGDFFIRGIRGLSLFAEYLNNPEATDAAFDAEGWFATGDRVRLAEDGWLFFGDRAKDMLKVGGENVAAAEIETHLAKHPAVKLAQVVGVPDDRLQEVPAAFIEKYPDQEVTEQALIDFCKGEIAGFKVPRYVRFVTEWPMSTSKIQKFRLRDRLLAELGSVTDSEALGG
jgi:crotonobetaine/carnitine-CoA ligase